MDATPDPGGAVPTPTNIDLTSVRTLCFSTCGANGHIFVGVLRALEDAFDAAGLSLHGRIRTAVGSSGGAIAALAIVLNFRSFELGAVLARFSEEYGPQLANLNVAALPQQLGMVTHELLQALARELLCLKLGDGAGDVTLRELQTRTRRRLIVAVHNVTHIRAEYVDAEAAPDLPVVTAVAMSCCIPVMFGPVSWRGCLYSDGGVSVGLPLAPCVMEETLAFCLLAVHPYVAPDAMKLSDYVCRLTHAGDVVTRDRLRSLPPAARRRIMTLDVPCLSPILFSGMQLTPAARERLVRAGELACMMLINQGTALVSHAVAVLLRVAMAMSAPTAVTLPAAAINQAQESGCSF